MWPILPAYASVQSSATSRTPFAFKHSMIHWLVQFTLHFAVTSVFHQCTNPETRAESCLSVPIIQTQLAFQLPNGHQTSFMAETDLIQRRLALTLKWQYKFTSSETHRPINKVHIYIYTSCFISILVAQDANVNVSLIAPMFRETRQTQAMTSQLLICNPSICRHEPDSIYVQFTLQFAVRSVFREWVGSWNCERSTNELYGWDWPP